MATAKSQQSAATAAADADSDAAVDQVQDPRDARIAELEEELAKARAPRQPTVTGTPVRLRVEGGHSEMHYAGRVIGREYTEVPAHQAAAFFEAADAAGVTLTQEQES